MPKPSAKDKLRQFFLDHIGIVVTSTQLRDAAGQGVSEWARRVRELRDEEGWPILTSHDLESLGPREYLMRDAPPSRPDVKFTRSISAKVRAQVFDRNGFTCQMCGATPGELDTETGRPVRLHIGHIVDKSLGGSDDLSNLRALCSTCNQGAKNVTTERPTSKWLISQVRRAGIDEQRAVYEKLRVKFEK